MSSVEKFQITCDATSDAGEPCTEVFTGYGEDIQYWRALSELEGWRPSVTGGEDLCIEHAVTAGGDR